MQLQYADACRPALCSARRFSPRPLRCVERAATQRRRTRAGRGRAARDPRPDAGDRRRRLRQDDDARVAGRQTGAHRRRPAAHLAAHFLAPRRAGDAAKSRPRAAPGARLRVDPTRTAIALGRHLSRHRRAVAARVRGTNRPGRELHDPGPRRLRRLDGPGAPRAAIRDHEEPLSAERHVPRHLLAHAQQPTAARRAAAHGVPVVPAVGRRAQATVPRVCGRKASAVRARLRRPLALLVAHARRAGIGASRIGAFRPCAGRRIPRHQPPAGCDLARAQTRRPRPRGGR